MLHWSLGLMRGNNTKPRANYNPELSLLLSTSFDSNALISQSENMGIDEGEYW